MAKRRRLGDLFLVGKPLEFDDGEGVIKIFLRKLNPIDHERALKQANAARSRLTARLKDEDTLEWQDLWCEVLDLDREQLTAYLLAEERMNRTPAIEAEVASEEPWVTDGYLEGLEDSWNDELRDRYAVNPEDPEALDAFNEIQRYVDEVEKALDGHLEAFSRDLEDDDDDKLRRTVMNRSISVAVNTEWMNEFRRSELWLSVREPDKKTLYFESRGEVDQLPLEIMSQLLVEYRALSVEPQEGKDSPGNQDSSD